MIDFRDIGYLREGNRRQRTVYRLLTENRILTQLAGFDPVVVGTFPLGIDIPGSDVDICCQYSRKSDFLDRLSTFERFLEYEWFETEKRDVESIVCRFEINRVPFELFAQQTAVNEQYAYLHMLIESLILEENGDTFRAQIIALKKKGLKTEIAFAKLLEIPGDPYDALIEYGKIRWPELGAEGR